MKVKEFVEKFVGHNSIVIIYNHKRVDSDTGFYDEFIPLWEGMDWQVVENSDDVKYCKERGLNRCPYNDDEVVQIKCLPHGDCTDYIDIIIGNLIRE